MLREAGVQIPENNLDDLHSSREEDGTSETLDPQDLLGLDVSLSRAVGFLKGTSVVVVIHTVKIDEVRQIVDVESSGKSAHEIDKETVSFGEMQLKQEDRSYVHASIKLHLHVVHVVPRKECLETDNELKIAPDRHL
ncbi:hypothetical protein Tco_0788966 [Tanacetum coccineum]